MRFYEWERHPVFGSQEPTDTANLLFHYTSLSNAAAVALTGQLLLSPLSVLNDPQESTTRSVATMTYGSREVPSRIVPDHEREGYDLALRNLRAGVRVACFTADAAVGTPGSPARDDGRGYARQRIWAQYGDSHHGVCLVFDRVRLEESTEREFGENFRSKPVHYVPGHDTASIKAVVADFDNPDPLNHFETRVLPSLLSKNADWEGEREHRIVAWDRSGPVCSLTVVDAIRGLVLGLAVQPRLLPVAQRIAEVFEVVDNTAGLMLSGSVLRAVPAIGINGKGSAE